MKNICFLKIRSLSFGVAFTLSSISLAGTISLDSETISSTVVASGFATSGGGTLTYPTAATMRFQFEGGCGAYTSAPSGYVDHPGAIGGIVTYTWKVKFTPSFPGDLPDSDGYTYVIERRDLDNAFADGSIHEDAVATASATASTWHLPVTYTAYVYDDDIGQYQPVQDPEGDAVYQSDDDIVANIKFPVASSKSGP